MRIFAIGDSITFGLGDRERLGWVGRLPAPLDVQYFNLGVSGQTIAEILARAHEELVRRIVPYHESFILIGGGLNDLSVDYQGQLRTDAQTLSAQIDALIGAVKAHGACVVIGPPPVDEKMNPFFISALGEDRDFKNAVIQEADKIYEKLSIKHKLPYLSLYNLLKDDPSYLGSLKDSDGVHPEEMGYIAIAQYISKWKAFRQNLPQE